MNRKRANFSGRRLVFESLETRRCMAGNVTAALVGVDLVVEGDAEANAISIVESATDGQFFILGGDDANGVATNVNGSANGLAVVSGVTGSLIVRFKDGNDVVDVANIDHAGALRVEAGAGNDAISAADVSLAEVSVHVGSDGNTVTFARIDVTGSVAVEAGFNDLTDIEPNAYLVVDSTIGLDLRMDLSVRAGAVSMSNTSIGRNVEINNASTWPSGVLYVAYSSVYAAIRLTDVIIGNDFNLNTSAVTLVHTDRVFTGGGFGVWSHTSGNALLMNNSRAVAGLYYSTVTAQAPLHVGSRVSTYDRVELSGVIADGGLTCLTSGDIIVRYSRFPVDSTIDFFYSDDIVIVDTTHFGGSLKLGLGNGDNTLEFVNSVVAGTLSIKQGSNFHFISTAALHNNFQRTSSMRIANNRLGTLEIAGGNLTDEVRISYCVCGNIAVTLADGSDLLELVATTVAQNVRLDGKTDFDLFVDRNNSFAGLELLNFEAVGG